MKRTLRHPYFGIVQIERLPDIGYRRSLRYAEIIMAAEMRVSVAENPVSVTENPVSVTETPVFVCHIPQRREEKKREEKKRGEKKRVCVRHRLVLSGRIICGDTELLRPTDTH